MTHRLATLAFALASSLMAAGQAHFRTVDGGTFGSSMGSDTFGNPDDYGNYGSNGYDGNTPGDGNSSWGRDTTRHKTPKVIPIGVHQWVIDPLLGHIIPAENNDTAVHLFQYYNATESPNGEYSLLGNLGSPRLSRIYMHRSDMHPLMFLEPYSFFLDDIRSFRYTNTLSPLTNLAYHKVGDRNSGHERLRAYFASSINKVAGLGFKLDYLYGQGSYNSQQNSQFGATFFGYYLGDKYNMHAWVNANHSKMGENGGIENDTYITDPQSFPRRYGTKDIPTMLVDTWNRNDNETYYLTHRYNIGTYRELEVPDSLKPEPPGTDELLKELSDSIQTLAKTDSLLRQRLADSLLVKWQAGIVPPTEFVPVSSIIHTMEVNTLRHTYYANSTPQDYYTQLHYGAPNKISDHTKALTIRNTVGLAMREGFNKWAAMGITLFGTHELRNFTLPILTPAEDETLPPLLDTRTYHENNLLVGGELVRTQGSIIHYNVRGDVTLVGTDLGQFRVDGRMDVNIPMGKRDTLQIEAHGFVKNLNPSFYYRHYHSHFAWWENNLSKEFKTRIEGSLHLPRTRTTLAVGMENVTNYTYFGMRNTLLKPETAEDGSPIMPASLQPSDFTRDVAVLQKGGSVQVLQATLKQDVKLGPLHWDNEVTYQTSTDSNVLPLPALNIFTNLYLSFRIAKVLNVELGGDCRYFTSYHAPDYAPQIGQFATQDATLPRIKIGNYPIVNAYVNMHLKRCRFYVAARHVNASHGHQFWAPHYAMNPMGIHLGISWNFFN